VNGRVLSGRAKNSRIVITGTTSHHPSVIMRLALKQADEIYGAYPSRYGSCVQTGAHESIGGTIPICIRTALCHIVYWRDVQRVGATNIR
jgi:hypothetical protein